MASLFFLLLLSLALSSAESKTFWADVEALKEFKNSVHADSVSPGSCLSSWDFSLDPCDSLFGERFTCGFRCDLVISGSARVTELSLDQAGYSGSLSSVSFNLPYLQTLDLTGNYFTGQLPDSLSHLTRLTRLALSRNSFSGSVPGSIGSITGLEEVLLDNNRLEGPVPANFNGISGLKRLEMQFNNLSGEFPDLGSLKNLSYLDASDNRISGRVPSSLPESLVQISMRNNFIGGTIPESLNLLNSLQVLDLSHNRLSGSIPSFIFTHSSLQQLTLSFNRFTSVQSPWYSPSGLPSQLIAVDLSNNEIQGILPLFMSLLPKLSALSLENNKISGMIPTQYVWKTVSPGSYFAPFERLLLGGNFLFGAIPGPLMELKPGSANVQLAGNCFFWCPTTLFFCQGRDQRPFMECRKFRGVIP
ncbi:PREDICTED: probable LRR receptor-like serine/threonine-protein kinase At1g06840 [Tarenaya hassleriana]|uniref:probable LRR receptor-like serine/threonine-protein kinase At1g06840 n=1 Tax=Tarenaya hassleriana TaxID=28532 RepID=UPI00053C5148|nr:PREDICTED: probable LRR receptor-like serine/threonine-protein kinase At1g06840 [Tarenaya hassleriana]